MEFLAVILGAPEPTNEINYRDSDCKTLFEYGFTNYETIIKLDKKFFKIFNDLITNGNTLNTVFKIILVISAFYFVYAFISHRSKKINNNSKKKNSKKINTDLNNFDEFKFRCSFW